MSLPVWELPFEWIGEGILLVPKALETAAKDVQAVSGAVESALPPAAATIVTLLGDAAMAVTDKGLNIALDGQVAQDFLAALAALKKLVGATPKAAKN